MSRVRAPQAPTEASEEPFLAAQSISDGGLLSKWSYSDIRSYGYPWFLTGAFGLARLLGVGPNTGVFLLQWPIFIASCWLMATTLASRRRVRAALLVAVGANPLIVGYTAQAFTESLTVSCVLLAVACLGQGSRGGASARVGGWLIAGALCASFAVAVRPGSLFVPAFYLAASGWVIFRHRTLPRLLPALLSALLVLAALTVPLLPQVAINSRNYDSVSPLPTFDLAHLQAAAGLSISRYVTNADDCAGVSTAFLLPNRGPVTADTTLTDALGVYLGSWPEGPEAMILHVFSGVDPRPFLTDQHDYGTGYERWLQALVLAVLLLAVLALAHDLRRGRDASGRMRVDVVLFGAVATAFLGVLAVSAAEFRFGVVPLACASVLAVVGVQRLRRFSSGQLIVLAVAYGITLLLWMTASDLLLSTNATWHGCR